MAWIDDIQNVFSITTGDGKKWTPKWLNANKEVEYNTSAFEFINVDGTLVLKKRPKGRKFDLEFYFDGDDNVLLGESFEKSARDSKAWVVNHPYYGSFKCQPLNIKQDNTKHNVTKFICATIETIADGFPKSTDVLPDKIQAAMDTMNLRGQEAFSAAGVYNKVKLKESALTVATKYLQKITDSTSLAQVNEFYGDVINAIDAPLFVAVDVMRSMHQLINLPASITQTLAERFNILTEAYNAIKEIFDGTKEGKHQFEAMASSFIGSMAVASISEYETRNEIAIQQENISEYYADFVTELDTMQTDRSDNPDSYTPDFETLNALNELINLTNSRLFELVFEAKQERFYTLEKDSNIILLVHRFYGLDNDDLNIEKFIKNNSIGLSEILNLRKGKTIVYYV